MEWIGRRATAGGDYKVGSDPSMKSSGSCTASGRTVLRSMEMDSRGKTWPSAGSVTHLGVWLGRWGQSSGLATHNAKEIPPPLVPRGRAGVGVERGSATRPPPLPSPEYQGRGMWGLRGASHDPIANGRCRYVVAAGWEAAWRSAADIGGSSGQKRCRGNCRIGRGSGSVFGPGFPAWHHLLYRGCPIFWGFSGDGKTVAVDGLSAGRTVMRRAFRKSAGPFRAVGGDAPTTGFGSIWRRCRSRSPIVSSGNRSDRSGPN